MIFFAEVCIINTNEGVFGTATNSFPCSRREDQNEEVVVIETNIDDRDSEENNNDYVKNDYDSSNYTGNKDNKSDRIDNVLTNKWAGIPIFLLIMFLIFHLTFSTNFLFLGGLFKNVKPSPTPSLAPSIIPGISAITKGSPFLGFTTPSDGSSVVKW